MQFNLLGDLEINWSKLISYQYYKNMKDVKMTHLFIKLIHLIVRNEEELGGWDENQEQRREI